MNKQDNKAYWALLSTCVFWGISWIASKTGALTMPALQLSAIRQLIAGSIFTFYFMFSDFKIPTKREFFRYTILAILLFVLGNGFSTWGVVYLPAGLGALIGAVYPLSVVLLERFFFSKKKITKLAVFGLVLGLLGIAIVFMDNIIYHPLPTHFFYGLALSFTAMFAWSLGTIYVGKFSKNDKVNPYRDMGWQMIIGGLILFAFCAITGKVISIAEITNKSWLCIAYLVIFGSCISFAAFVYTMKKLPVAIASIYAYINPIVALSVASIFLNEPFTFKIILGSIITLIGVFIVNYDNYKINKSAEDII